MFNISLKLESQVKKIDGAICTSDAIEKSFEYGLDKVLISLDSVEIRMNLVYEFSDLLDDFLGLLADIVGSQRDEGWYGFSQNEAFDADWDVRWNDDLLEIDVAWRALKGMDVLALPAAFRFSKKAFIGSWKKFFSELSSKLDLRNI